MTAVLPAHGGWGAASSPHPCGDLLPDALRASWGLSRGGDAGREAASDEMTGRTETFCLMHPSSTNGHRGVYLYVDESGMLKNLPTNARAAALVERCGLEAKHAFHGDAYVGAVVTTPEPMHNVDFTADDLSPDAAWLARAPTENRAYAVEMAKFMAAVAGKKVSDEDRRGIMEDRAVAVEDGGVADDADDRHPLLSKEGLDAYFAGLVAGLPVEVRAIAGRGNAVVAVRDITQGEVLWSEPPVVSAQEPANASKAMTCAWCHRSVGDIDAQLSLAAGLCSAEEALEGCIAMQGTEGVGGLSARRGWADVARHGLPAMEQAEAIAPAVPCRRRHTRGCPSAYCSTHCRAAHRRNGHALLCCGSGGDVARGKGCPGGDEADEAEAAAADAAAAFRRHCGHSDVLVLVTGIVGRIAHALSRGEDWDAATLVFRGFVGDLWWRNNESNETPAGRRLRSVAGGSMELMKQAALWSETAAAAIAEKGDGGNEGDEEEEATATAERATMAKVPEVLARLGLAGYGHLLGLCDMNQWSLKVDGPMRNVVRRLLQIDEYEGSDAAAPTLAALLPLALAAQAKRDEEDEAEGRPRWGGHSDADEDEKDEEELSLEEEIRLDETSDAEDLFDTSRRLFPMFSGMGLFALTCLCNHACEPSAVTRYSSWKGRTMVRVEALRDIRAGEELLLSYIDEGEPLEERTKALESYGFTCECRKCVEERLQREVD